MFFLSQKNSSASVSNFIKSRHKRVSNLILLTGAILSITLLSACGGSDESSFNGGNNNTGTGTTTVAASPDTVSTQQDSAVNIAVLTNDSGVSDSAILSIEVAPGNGTATVMANNTINYSPSASFTGTESFSYKIASNGNVSVATVSVNVQCSDCSKEITINLSWLPTTTDDDIGYLVYYGSNAKDINALAFDLSLQTGLDPNNPKVAFSAQNDLKLSQGDNVCFQISAYTANAQSNFSDPICGSI